MLRQLARTASRASATAARVQTRSLHSPFAVLSGTKPERAASEASKPTAAAAVQSQSSPTEKNEFDESSPESTNPRVYVVSYPDPALGAPFGVQLGAYSAGEPFAH